MLLSPLALSQRSILELFVHRRGLRPARAVLALGAVLLSLSGTLIEVDSARVHIRIRIL